MPSSEIEISVLTTIDAIPAADWDACAIPDCGTGTRPADPFVTHRFLLGLEQSGSVGSGSGWGPRPLVARSNGQVIAVAPLYVKGHSQGEYVFDHNWAHAYEQAGGQYYPKLQIAVPFTPVTGRRLLVRPGWDAAGMSALVQGAVQVAAEHQLSSLHMSYCTSEEAAAGEEMGLLHRTGQQFHWQNHEYADFDAFLAGLSSRKRKAIRRERRQAGAFGGQIEMLTGDQIRPEHWDAFWTFYQDTGARKWGSPYLTRAFFDHLHESLTDDILLVMASRQGRWVAGALNFIGRPTRPRRLTVSVSVFVTESTDRTTTKRRCWTSPGTW